jgi:DNA-binding response OmpR family regulator
VARILIIDDDAAVRTVLRVALAAAGHEVREAGDGTRGLQELDRWPAELVLCDLYMPGMEGLETIRALRGRAAGVPVVAMSGGAGGAGHNLLPVAAKLGAAGVLKKPFALRALYAAVAAALGPVGAP